MDHTPATTAAARQGAEGPKSHLNSRKTAGWLALREGRARAGKAGGVTDARTPEVAECLHCGVEFTPRKLGHVFHSIECRHRGARPAHERKPIDLDAIERLFDESRDPDELVRLDDWFPGTHDPRWVELFAADTVGKRRRWYRTLQETGRL